MGMRRAKTSCKTATTRILTASSRMILTSTEDNFQKMKKMGSMENSTWLWTKRLHRTCSINTAQIKTTWARTLSRGKKAETGRVPRSSRAANKNKTTVNPWSTIPKLQCHHLLTRKFYNSIGILPIQSSTTKAIANWDLLPKIRYCTISHLEKLQIRKCFWLSVFWRINKSTRNRVMAMTTVQKASTR